MTQAFRFIAPLLVILGIQVRMLALTADVSVDAKLSHRVSEVGAPMQLEIRVDGGAVDGRAPNLKVDGLEINFIGPSYSTGIETLNGRTRTSIHTTLSYDVIAQREGDFTIPSVALSVGGKTYSTQPIALKVQKRGTKGAGNDAANAIAFAEIDVAKKTAYVGEVVPVEVRLYIKAGIRSEVSKMIDISGDGFTVQKSPEPQQQTEMRNGTEYGVIIYRTVMTPSKAGKLTVGPTEIPFVAQVPRPRQGGKGSFGGQVFDLDDIFGGLSRFEERRRFEQQAPAVEIDVKPLPAEGRPKNFSGAVGVFSFQGEGSPTRLKVGDPVTMRLKVSGTGNFDRMTAPAMENDQGWQAYDASEKFEPVDAMKTTGSKTFEMPIVPNGPHRETPTFVFAYFDPKAEKYVTLRSKPQALMIEGTAAAGAAAKPEIQSQPPEERPKAESRAATDLLGLRYEAGTIRAFSPLYARREFWLVQGIPALGMLVLVAARMMRRDPRRVQHAALERQRADAWKRLRGDQNPADFWEHAARVVQFDTAIATGVEPGGVDADVVRRVRALDPETMVGVEEIFENRGALLFAGRGASERQIAPEQRSRILATLEKLGRR
jgi:hypothetical protein